jgi:hypothetical protein
MTRELSLDEQIRMAESIIRDSNAAERTAHRQIGRARNQPVAEPVSDLGFIEPETEDDRQRRAALVREAEAQAERMAAFERQRTGR